MQHGNIKDKMPLPRRPVQLAPEISPTEPPFAPAY